MYRIIKKKTFWKAFGFCLYPFIYIKLLQYLKVSTIYKSNECVVGTRWSTINKIGTKNKKRYNLSKDKINYCNINAWWKELGKYLMSMVKFISIKNKGQPLLLLEIHSPTESILVKAQKISLLIKLYANNMKLYQNWAPSWHPQETIINKNRFTKTKICMETPLNRNSLRIEAKNINLLSHNTNPNWRVFPNRPKKFANS